MLTLTGKKRKIAFMVSPYFKILSLTLLICLLQGCASAQKIGKGVASVHTADAAQHLLLEHLQDEKYRSVVEGHLKSVELILSDLQSVDNAESMIEFVKEHGFEVNRAQMSYQAIVESVRSYNAEFKTESPARLKRYHSDVVAAQVEINKALRLGDSKVKVAQFSAFLVKILAAKHGILL